MPALSSGTPIRTTHTYVLLELSVEAYKEIEGKLKAAGYDHVFHKGVIDMEGIGVTKADKAEVKA